MKINQVNPSKKWIAGALFFAFMGVANAQNTDTAKVKADAKAKAEISTNADVAISQQVEVAAQTNPTIEGLKKQVETNPKDNEAWVKLATAYQDAKDWPNALQTWTKIATLIPDWAPAYYSQGYVYQSMKDNDNAKLAYEKYISMVKPAELEANKKNLAYAHFFIAYSNFETDKAKAKVEVAKSLELDPTNTQAQELSKALEK